MMRFHRQSPAPVPAVASHCATARLAAILCAAALLAPATSFAQQPQEPTPQHKTVHHRAAQKPAPGQSVQPVAPPAPVAPPPPKWPANDPPSPPAVSFDSHGLHIVAENSSLNSILDQVSTETGAKVEGLSGDERVFGDFGPGQSRDVLSQLLSGVNYNVLIVGDEALGEPLHVMLSPRPSGPATNNRTQPQEEEEDIQPEPEEPPYQPPVIRPPINPNPQPPSNRPMTPQERLQQMQERQRELQQQQQQQQQPQ